MTIRSRIRRHLAEPGSHHRRIITGFLWVSFFVFVGRLTGAAKEMTIAWRYGVSEMVDAYVFIVNIISLPISVCFNVLAMVLLPILAKIRNGNPTDLPRFRGELFGLTLVAGAGLSGVTYFCLPVLLNAYWARFPGQALQQALAMAGPLSLLLPIGMVISFFSAWMMACGQHRNTLLEAFPALSILVALLLPMGWVPEPLIWGSIVGFCLHLAGLGWSLRRLGEFHRPILSFQSPAWSNFWGSFGIMVGGQILMSFNGIVDQFFAAHFGPGAISRLSYANRIISLIVSLGAIAISRSTLPIFSELSGKGKTIEIRVLTIRWVKLMFLFGAAVMAGLWVTSNWVVQLLFQRGAFTVEDTIKVSEIIRYLLLQLPFYFSGIVWVSLLSSRQKFTTIQWITCSNFLFKILSILLLTPVLGINGIALSTSIMYIASALMFTIACLKMKYD